MNKPYTLHLGDCLETLRGMPDCSVHAIVTDPPYGLSFMGKRWDYDVPGVEVWAECLRVLKPGGHLLAFAGTRTQHRMAVRIEDAGFEIRDMIAWCYGSGMPKSFNLDRERSKSVCGCGGALQYAHGNEAYSAGEAETDSDQLCSLQQGGSEAKCLAEEGSSTDVQPSVQRQTARTNADSQGLQARGPARTEPEAAGAEQSSVEGRGDAPQAARELRPGAIHQGTGVGQANGAGGRVRDGAPAGDGAVVRPPADADGMRTPRGSQPAEQQPVEPGVVAGQSKPQAVGAWPVCGGCGLPVVPRGLGSALKPALEPITVARKPLVGTVAENVLQHGTGALNIDGCRVHSDDAQGGTYTVKRFAPGASVNKDGNWKQEAEFTGEMKPGRWPANLIHDGSDDVLAAFPQAPGQKADINGLAPSHKTSNVYDRMRREGESSADSDNKGAVGFKMKPGMRRPDTGSAARFFYCAKASKRDRDEGLDAMTTVTADPYGQHRGRRMEGNDTRIDGKPPAQGKNHHPTVKPTDLMVYLVRLVTPPGGLVLDPFMGSGSTGKAAIREGFRFIGCEMSPDYLEIAEARIAHELARIEASRAAAPQLDLFGEARP